MKFEVKTEHKGGTVTDHVFSNWFECRGFLLLLTDNDRILIRDIAESILQIGIYKHHNKWYNLIVKCEPDITVLSEKEAHYCGYDCKIVKHIGL